MYELTLQARQPIEMILAGDFHIGHEKFNEEMFLRMLRYVAEDPTHRKWIGMGDYVEMNSPTDTPKGAIWNQVLTPQQQMNLLVDTCEEEDAIPEALISGNHEDRLWNNKGISLVEIASRLLKCLDADDGGYFKINVNRFSYAFWLVHGKGGSQTKNYSLRKAIELVGTDDADVVAIGHNHTLYYDRVLRVKMGGRRIVHTLRTGSFLGGTTWEDQPKYARKSSYPLAEIGCPIVKLWHDRHQIKVDMETLVL